MIDDHPEKLAHELADVLWSTIVLAEHCRVDLEAVFLGTMEELEGSLRRAGRHRVDRDALGAGSLGVPSHIRYEVGTHPSVLPVYVRGMEEARCVLERFDRIETMRRANAGPVELLEELRALLREAEAWAKEEGGDAGSTAVGRLRAALARDMIGA